MNDWLAAGQGPTPRLGWSYTADAPLVCLEAAAESGDVLAADAAGGMNLLDRRGKLVALTRGFQELDLLAFADAGNFGAAAVDGSRLVFFDRRLEVLWSADLHDAITALSVSPHGGHVAASTADSRTRVYDSAKKPVTRFDTIRPLHHLRFLAAVPELIGAAEHGLFCRYTLDGLSLWSEKLWSNVGDMTAVGDGGTIYLAAFNHGVQAYDGDGETLGTYVLEGTPSCVSSSYVSKRLAVVTQERQIFWIDSGGDVLWTANLPDAVCGVRTDPLGGGMVCGFDSGRVVKLDWGAGM